MQTAAREMPMRSVERGVHREVKYKGTSLCETAVQNLARHGPEQPELDSRLVLLRAGGWIG